MKPCDLCGAANAELEFSIRYAEFPPGKWARRSALLSRQLGSLDLGLCNSCRWAHFRNKQAGLVAFILLFVAFLYYVDPSVREPAWGIAFAALLPIALVIVLPLLPSGLSELEQHLYQRHKERIAAKHGIAHSRLRLIRR